MNRGIKNEYNIVNAFNGKKISELSAFQKKIIFSIFDNVNENDVVHADICNRYSKPDIYLSIKNSVKYISVKSGKNDSMHFENIKTFILFLRKNGISTRVQKLILFFHYGDGTLNGTGKKRFDFETLSSKYYRFIKEINVELNNNLILRKCLLRFVFCGIEGRTTFSDYIYHGNENYGVLVEKDELINYVLNKSYFYYKNIHIGPLVIQPYLRDVKRKSKNVFKRNIVQVKWYYLLSDLEKINKI